jgi:hypothetical protein
MHQTTPACIRSWPACAGQTFAHQLLCQCYKRHTPLASRPLTSSHPMTRVGLTRLTATESSAVSRPRAPIRDSTRSDHGAMCRSYAHIMPRGCALSRMLTKIRMIPIMLSAVKWTTRSIRSTVDSRTTNHHSRACPHSRQAERYTMTTYTPNDIDNAINLLRRAENGEVLHPSTLRLARHALKEWAKSLRAFAAHNPDTNVAAIVTRMADHYTMLSRGG